MKKQSTIGTNFTISSQVAQHWNSVLNLPETKSAKAKFDTEACARATSGIHAAAATLINFEYYKRSMQAIKARQSIPDPQVERQVVARYENALEAYKSFVSSLQKVNNLLEKCGFDQVLNANAAKLCWQLPFAPAYPRITDHLRALGYTDPDIFHLAAALKANKWDLFALHGANGTFAGLVKLGLDEVPTHEKIVSAVKKHGLPSVEGNNGIPTGCWIVAGGVTALGIVNIILGALFDWW